MAIHIAKNSSLRQLCRRVAIKQKAKEAKDSRLLNREREGERTEYTEIKRERVTNMLSIKL